MTPARAAARMMDERNRGRDHRKRHHRLAHARRGCRPAAGTTDSRPPGAHPRFASLFPAHQPTVEGRRGWVGGTLSRMDAATELTRMYLQRVPTIHPRRPSQANAQSRCLGFGFRYRAMATEEVEGTATATAAEHGSALRGLFPAPCTALGNAASHKRQKPGRSRAFAVLPAGSRRIPRQARWISAWRTGWRDVPCADRPSYARLHGRHGS